MLSGENFVRLLLGENCVQPLHGGENGARKFLSAQFGFWAAEGGALQSDDMSSLFGRQLRDF